MDKSTEAALEHIRAAADEAYSWQYEPDDVKVPDSVEWVRLTNVMSAFAEDTTEAVKEGNPPPTLTDAVRTAKDVRRCLKRGARTERAAADIFALLQQAAAACTAAAGGGSSSSSSPPTSISVVAAAAPAPASPGASLTHASAAAAAAAAAAALPYAAPTVTVTATGSRPGSETFSVTAVLHAAPPPQPSSPTVPVVHPLVGAVSVPAAARSPGHLLGDDRAAAAAAAAAAAEALVMKREAVSAPADMRASPSVETWNFDPRRARFLRVWLRLFGDAPCVPVEQFADTLRQYVLLPPAPHPVQHLVADVAMPALCSTVAGAAEGGAPASAEVPSPGASRYGSSFWSNHKYAEFGGAAYGTGRLVTRAAFLRFLALFVDGKHFPGRDKDGKAEDHIVVEEDAIIAAYGRGVVAAGSAPRSSGADPDVCLMAAAFGTFAAGGCPGAWVGYMDRVRVEDYLQRKPPGTFLFRFSGSLPCVASLSRHDAGTPGKIVHELLQLTSSGAAMRYHDRAYVSLAHLVCDADMCARHGLLYPAATAPRSPRLLPFFGLTSFNDTAKVLTDDSALIKAHNGTYVLRLSQSKPGSVVIAYVHSGGVKQSMIDPAPEGGGAVTLSHTSHRNLEEALRTYAAVFETPLLPHDWSVQPSMQVPPAAAPAAAPAAVTVQHSAHSSPATAAGRQLAHSFSADGRHMQLGSAQSSATRSPEFGFLPLRTASTAASTASTATTADMAASAAAAATVTPNAPFGYHAMPAPAHGKPVVGVHSGLSFSRVVHDTPYHSPTPVDRGPFSHGGYGHGSGVATGSGSGTHSTTSSLFLDGPDALALSGTGAGSGSRVVSGPHSAFLHAFPPRVASSATSSTHSTDLATVSPFTSLDHTGRSPMYASNFLQDSPGEGGHAVLPPPPGHGGHGGHGTPVDARLGSAAAAAAAMAGDGSGGGGVPLSDTRSPRYDGSSAPHNASSPAPVTAPHNASSPAHAPASAPAHSAAAVTAAAAAAHMPSIVAENMKWGIATAGRPRKHSAGSAGDSVGHAGGSTGGDGAAPAAAVPTAAASGLPPASQRRSPAAVSAASAALSSSSPPASVLPVLPVLPAQGGAGSAQEGQNDAAHAAHS